MFFLVHGSTTEYTGVNGQTRCVQPAMGMGSGCHGNISIHFHPDLADQ